METLHIRFSASSFIQYLFKADIEKWKNKERMRRKTKREMMRNKVAPEMLAVGKVPLVESEENRKQKMQNWQQAQRQVSFKLYISIFLPSLYVSFP